MDETQPANLPGSPPPPATTIPPAVRVKVRWDERRGTANIESTHRLPNCMLVAAELTSAQRALVGKRQLNKDYSIQDWIARTRETIPVQVWSDAIGAATVKALACTAVAAETIMADFANGALMAVGDSIYRLSMTQHQPASRALALLRRKATESARHEAAVIKANADQAAKAILENAQRIKREAELELARARVNNPPPKWAVDARQPLKFSSDRWQIGFVTGIQLTELATVQSWAAANGRVVQYRKVWQAMLIQPVKVLFWLPLQVDGSYAATSIYIDSISTQLPHVSNIKGCMEIADAPARIGSTGDLARFIESLERVMAGVNLDSLLVPFCSWLPAFKAAVPPDLRAVLQSSTWTSELNQLVQRLYTEEQGSLERVDVAREAGEVWHA